MVTNYHDWFLELSLAFIVPIVLLIINLILNKVSQSYKKNRQLWINWSVVISLFWMFIIWYIFFITIFT